MRIFLSKQPKAMGGGANTFSWLFSKYAKRRGLKIVWKIGLADMAVIIAHLAEEEAIREAKSNGCYIIHRLDEYFEKNEDAFRQWKHEKIIRLNRYANLTIFQSQFVFRNVYPFIKPKNYRIIHNGGDHELFFPSKEQGNYIGHATWGFAPKKRLNLLYDFIRKKPNEKFLLVGRQKHSEFDFNLPNVRMVGEVRRKKMAKYFRKMKLFYFPSENDPCPNSVIEAIMCGVPVCYNPIGGTRELIIGQAGNPVENGFIQDSQEDVVCGLPLGRVEEMLQDIESFRKNCLHRKDLFFTNVFDQYFRAYEDGVKSHCSG